MPKPKAIDPGISKNISIPESVVAQVDALLFSPTEARVPHGAYSRLITMLLRQWLEKLPTVEAHVFPAEALLKELDA